jgi:hypothetical protein
MKLSYLLLSSLIGIALCAPQTYADDKKYTLQDLQVLEKSKAWPELFGHLEDVAPAQRDAAWNQLVMNACFQKEQTSPYYDEWCFPQLLSIVNANPANTDLAWQAGKWARQRRAQWTAVPFFHKAALKSGDPRCKDEDVSIAVLAALGQPAAKDPELIRLSQDLAFEKCWPELSAGLKKGIGEGSYVFTNACAGMKKKGALSGIQTKRCENAK